MLKTSKTYWDNNWENTSPPVSGVNPELFGWRDFHERSLHDYFLINLQGRHLSGKRLLEAGCARSRWLPYFARVFGMSVTGIDYSQIGCAMAKDILDRENCPGEIICGDLFASPSNMNESFDMVVSFGLVEHFAPVSECLAALAHFLKPGGLLLTIVPNLSPFNLNRFIQTILDRSCLDKHVTITIESLVSAHQECCLSIISVQYLMVFHAGLFSRHKLDLSHPSFSELIGRLFVGTAFVIDQASMRTYVVKPNRWTSPFIACIAEKPPLLKCK